VRPILDRSDPDQPTVQLLVADARSGEPFFEEVPVEILGDGRYRLLASPGLLDGLAAGDVFVRHDDGAYEVAEHAGNLCVQVWFPGNDPGARLEAELVPAVITLGGWLDGRTPGVATFTIPVAVGFQAVEALFDGWVADLEGVGWSYANVYGPDGDTQLGWWTPTVD
jgi:Domain of unknown function (DUF4265)